MSNPFLAEIRIVSFGFAPKGWAFCNGQLLPINQNQALFALLGTTYGGDGITTFGVPSLQGRVPIHMGGGHVQGEKAGEESHTLITTEMPSHTHPANGGALSSGTPVNNFWGDGTSVGVNLYASSPVDSPMDAAAIGNNTGGQPHENRSPFLVVNYVIALTGLFPSRN